MGMLSAMMAPSNGKNIANSDVRDSFHTEQLLMHVIDCLKEDGV